MPTPTPTRGSTNTTTDAPADNRALVAMRDVLMAIPESEIARKPGLDPTAAAMIVQGSLVNLEPFRPALVAQFGEPASTLLDQLPGCARATHQAAIELRNATAADMSSMYEEVRTAYARLITDADSLAQRKLLDPKTLDTARDIQGYQQLITSTLSLAGTLSARWSQIEKHTPLTAEDVAHAQRAAERMFQALGEREVASSRGPAAELRIRALSHLIRQYDQVRRMMGYLRWEQDDVDAIVPSLWLSRGRRSKSRSGDEPRETDTPVTDPTEPSPATPSPNNGGGPFMDD